MLPDGRCCPEGTTTNKVSATALPDVATLRDVAALTDVGALRDVAALTDVGAPRDVAALTDLLPPTTNKETTTTKWSYKRGDAIGLHSLLTD